MAFANEQQYEEMISALQTFKTEAQEKCQTLTAVGSECVENTQNDPAAAKSNSSVQQCVGQIEAQLEEIDRIAQELADELDRIREAAAKANNLGDY